MGSSKGFLRTASRYTAESRMMRPRAESEPEAEALFSPRALYLHVCTQQIVDVVDRRGVVRSI